MTAKVKATMSERTENVVFGLRIAEKLKLDNARVNRADEQVWICENGVGYNGSEADIRRLANLKV